MVKDRRYLLAKAAVQKGELTLFRQLFDYVPKTVVAEDMKIKPARLDYLMFHIEFFRYGHVGMLAKLLGIRGMKGLSIVGDLYFNQYEEDKKNPPTTEQIRSRKKIRKKRK